MDKPKEFIKSVAIVVNELSNSGFKMDCQPNVNNEEVLSFTVHKNADVEITVKGNGNIRMVFDKKLSIPNKFSKDPYDFTQADFSALEYGYTEREDFPKDFKLI